MNNQTITHPVLTHPKKTNTSGTITHPASTHPKKFNKNIKKGGKKPFWNNKSRCEQVDKWSHDKYESDDEDELIVIFGLPPTKSKYRE